MAADLTLMSTLFMLNTFCNLRNASIPRQLHFPPDPSAPKQPVSCDHNPLQGTSESSEVTEDQILQVIHRVFRVAWCGQNPELLHLPDLAEAVLEDPDGKLAPVNRLSFQLQLETRPCLHHVSHRLSFQS